MSFIFNRKSGNSVYSYRITGYRDKETGKVRQKREYLGVLDPGTGEVSTPRRDKWAGRAAVVSGVAHAVGECSRANRLRETLDAALGEEAGGGAFALAAYCATEGAPMYLYENWAHSMEGMAGSAMSSRKVSVFLRRLGEDEKGRAAFWEAWSRLHGRNRNLVFDITSISTHSKGLELDEFGYNRDGESLPQVNVGMVYSDRPGTPLGYKVYPGSVGDVSTVKSLIHYLEHDLGLPKARLVLDRGFFSAANIRGLDSAGHDYLIPLPSGLAVARELLRETEGAFGDESAYFEFNGRLMAHAEACRDYAGDFRRFHVFVDFRRRSDETKALLARLKTVEERFADQKFSDAGEAEAFVESVAKGTAGLLKFRKAGRRVGIARDSAAIHQRAMRFGKFILLPRNFGREPLPMLADYFRRDGVEKFFDTLKNEMDSGRGRVHSQEAFDGRLFVHMLGLIIHGEMTGRIKANEKATKLKMAFPEVVSNLKRLRRTRSADGAGSLGELTKKQRLIFAALGIDPPK